MWVRGLKHDKAQHQISAQNVAPYVGAWIETEMNNIIASASKSHPMWVRGLKH